MREIFLLLLLVVFSLQQSPVIITEIYAHTDESWIELYNGSPVDYPLTNHSFVDVFTKNGVKNTVTLTLQTTKFVPGLAYITLDPSDWGGYTFESCSHFISFKDSLRVAIDNHTIGFSPDGLSYGRYDITVTQFIFVLLTAPSPGVANNEPYVSSLGITEIMYWPLLGEYSYIVVENFVDTVQYLFYQGDDRTPPLPKVNFKFSGNLDFNFPDNAVLGPYRRLVVTEADPVVFRQRYSVPPWVQVFGPWSGTFNFSVDPRKAKVKLEVPGSVDSLGNSDIYKIEDIEPDVYVPWPPGTAATGKSILRVSNKVYGGFATNWISTNSSIMYKPPPNDNWVQPSLYVPVKLPKRTSKPSTIAPIGPDLFSSDLLNLNANLSLSHYLLIGLVSFITVSAFIVALAYQIYRTMPKSTQAADKD